MSSRSPDEQSGNRPKGQHSAPKHSALEFLTEQLREPVAVTGSDGDRKVSKLEAILRQLYRKMLSGDRRALAVWMKYEEFAAKNSEVTIEIQFVDNDYTRALAARSEKRTDDG